MNSTNWQQIHQSLFSFIYKKVEEEALAKDILQDVLIKIQLKLPQLKDQTKLFSWLQTIARNSITDHFRATKKRANVPLLEEEIRQSNHAEDNENAFMKDCIPSFMQSLPDKYREALYLVEIEGLSQKELAARLNISYSGAKSRVQRGRERLKSVILDCCQVSTDVYGNVLEYQKNNGCGKDC